MGDEYNLDTGGIIENTVYEDANTSILYFVKCVAKYMDSNDLVVILNKVFTDHKVNPNIKVPFGDRYSIDDIAVPYEDFTNTIVTAEGSVVRRYREICLEEMNEIAPEYKEKYPLFLRFRKSFKDE